MLPGVMIVLKLSLSILIKNMMTKKRRRKKCISMNQNRENANNRNQVSTIEQAKGVTKDLLVYISLKH